VALRLAAALTATTLGSCAAPNTDEESLAASPIPTWESYLASAQRTPDGGFVVEWDLWFPDEAALLEYYQMLIDSSAEKAHVWTQISTGKRLVWPVSRAQDIRYCVSQASLGANYQIIVDEMKLAASEWESVANINFRYVATEDSNCTPANASIDLAVQHHGTVGCAVPPLANWTGTPPTIMPCGVPKLLGINYTLANSAGQNPKSSLGVLRHELGHAIGFRHEHAFQIGEEGYGCGEFAQLESADQGGEALIESYDADSVMHYPSLECGWGHNHDYILTPKDGRSARALYGMPASWYIATGLLL